ncbi:MAG: hypothetical protein M3512_04995 [Bacteroidota bacterium]|nr:hypothetical protein [Bacteroidota bacterium]
MSRTTCYRYIDIISKI